MQLADRPDIQPRPVALDQPKGRLDWVDNLRTLMIVLVVNMHACVTYSFVGSWYYNAPPEPSIPAKIPFLIWQASLQSFFMGLLFFIGGYYADRSVTRRGTASFLSERARRLGLPTLLYMLALHPLIVIVLHPGYAPSADPVHDYLNYLSSGSFIGSNGPMWFAFALLIFSVFYAGIASRVQACGTKSFDLTASIIVAIAFLTGACSFLVRTVQPLGSSILNFQLAYFSQYVMAFAFGLLVSRRDWFNALAVAPIARKAGWIGLIAAPISLLGVIVASLPVPKTGSPAFMGGWNLVAFAMAEWEQFAGICLGLGVIALCASQLNFRSRISRWLSDRSFGVYLLHPPILVAISLLVQPYRTSAAVMASVVTVIALLASFAAADLARRIPWFRTML